MKVGLLGDKCPQVRVKVLGGSLPQDRVRVLVLKGKLLSAKVRVVEGRSP